jgi:2-keto-4-pentenoate hydratase
MRLAHDLPDGADLAAATAAVGQIYPALEIIETHGPATQIPLMLPDNAQQKTCVLGAPARLPQTLETILCTVRINKAVVATGTGDAVLGNPLNSLVWLAGKLPQYGRQLKAGEIVMTGSFTRQFPIAPGERVHVAFSGVGDVAMSMAA